MAAMTFNTTSIPLKQIPVGGVLFHVDAYNADVTGTEDVVAAVAGKSHYIQRMILTIDGLTGDPTVTVGSGETASAVTKTMVGPLSVAAEVVTGIPANEEHFVPAKTYVYDFDQGRNMGRKLTVGEALTIDSSAAVPVNIWVEGVTV